MKPTARQRAAARKSTALITLALVPLNLMGLGFTGCDSQDDAAVSGNDYAQQAVNVEAPEDGSLFTADFPDPDDPFTLDPLPVPVNGPTTRPTSATQPAPAQVGKTAFANQPSYGSARTSTYHGGFLFLPIPYGPSYRPPYRPPSAFTGGGGYSRGYSGYSRGYTPAPRYSGTSGGLSRSTGSSGVSHSSGTSRGGFGSTGSSMSHSSGS
jgi:hypothetical protein